MLQRNLLDTRLALILLDNVAELLMYRELRHTFAWNDSIMPRINIQVPGIEFPTPPYSPEERRQAEREFDPKVKLLSHRL